VFRVPEDLGVPERWRAGKEPGPHRRHGLEDRRQQPLRLVDIDEADDP
jgi:hypothetical protein